MKAKISVRIEFSEGLHPVVIEAEVGHLAQFDELMHTVGQTLQRSRRLVRNVVEHKNHDDNDSNTASAADRLREFRPLNLQPHIERLQMHTTNQ